MGGSSEIRGCCCNRSPRQSDDVRGVIPLRGHPLSEHLHWCLPMRVPKLPTTVDPLRVRPNYQGHLLHYRSSSVFRVVLDLGSRLATVLPSAPSRSSSSVSSTTICRSHGCAPQLP